MTDRDATRERARRGGSKLIVLLAALFGVLAFSVTLSSAQVDPAGSTGAPALLAFTQPNHVSFSLEACRLPDANHDGIPDYTLPNASGFYICNDADYVSGNLGKSWNELDLVPHRVTTTVGNQVNATTDYDFIVAADYLLNNKVGYDVIGGFAVNPAKSDASCQITNIGPESTATGVTGGVDTIKYVTLSMHQNKGTTCVIDYYQRLALGAHLYSGSSLQSYMFESENFQTGKRTLSIPVNEILPQELSKDMSATQGSDHVWEITKEPTPASLSFSNTCDPDGAKSAAVQIAVTWTKLAATPSGPITVLTHVYAKNPAARVITVNVTDDIYSGLAKLDTATATADVPANTIQLVLTHQTTVAAGTTNLNDIATATYTDKVTGVPVPGNTTATASANVQSSGVEKNQTATINDVESITGSGLSYSVDSFTPAIGLFDGGYAAGTHTTGSVSWTSLSQSDSGTVTFDKTVYVGAGANVTGSLDDTATLTGSDGFTASATGSVTISAVAKATLTIDKTIPNILQGSETATFDFTVKDAGNNTVATPSLSFAAGDTHKTVDVGNLTPGVYTVSETPPTGFEALDPIQVDLSGTVCAGTASFTNVAQPAAAKVKKVTAPAGFEAGWTFDLKDGQGTVLESKTTTGSGFVNFTTQLGEGTYSIVETAQDGWASDGGDAGCSFTVDLPADANKVFACTFTNTYSPSVKLTKKGDTLSKIGDDVNYTITLENTSVNGGDAGAPSLVCDISDPTIGFTKTVTLPPGDSDTSNPTFTIPAGADDPFVNTATADCHYPGLADVVATSQDDHSTNLFQPSVKLTKTGDALSKVGDKVDYSVTIENTSSSDSPDLVLDSFSDTLVAGVVPGATCSPLAPGASCTVTYDYTVKAGDPDPLVNTATVHYKPSGFPNDITASDDHSTNLFQPSVEVTKTGPSYSKAGDSVKYTITIKNTSSTDSPNLELQSFGDSLVSGVTPPQSCNTLAPAGTCTFDYTYTVQAGDPDPLVNTATVHYKPVGFPNDVNADGKATVDLVHPSFTVTKNCKADTEPISQSGPAVFTITFNNTGDADLHVVPSEGVDFNVAAGQSHSYDYSVAGPFSDTVSNTVTGDVTLAQKYGLANSYTFSAGGTCTVAGKAKVAKTVSGQPPAADQTFTFELRKGASTVSDGTVLESVNTDATGNISFNTELVPGQTYQICEWVFPGWNTNLAGDGPLFVPNSIIPPSLPNPNVNNLAVCADFTVTSGQTRTFTVDNSPPPGGRALTIGFWKNWASCSKSGGNQDPMLDLALAYATQQATDPPGGLVVSAQYAGSGWPNFASLWYLVMKGNAASTEDNILVAPDCAKAVNLLNKSTFAGKKMASDPLFNMTAQLVGAQLNRFMGAGISGTTITNINRAVLLDGKYAFDGLTYTPKLSKADTSLANCLATQLDRYNNNLPVSTCP